MTTAVACGHGKIVGSRYQQALGHTRSRDAGQTWPSLGILSAKAWSVLALLAALVLVSPAALQAQTFQTAQPLFFTMPYQGANPLPQVLTVASTTGDGIQLLHRRYDDNRRQLAHDQHLVFVQQCNSVWRRG